MLCKKETDGFTFDCSVVIDEYILKLFGRSHMIYTETLEFTINKKSEMVFVVYDISKNGRVVTPATKPAQIPETKLSTSGEVYILVGIINFRSPYSGMGHYTALIPKNSSTGPMFIEYDSLQSIEKPYKNTYIYPKILIYLLQ